MANRWPARLMVSAGRDALTVTFEDGEAVTLSAEHLRVFTPSAERVGHGGAPLVIGGKRTVTLTRVEPVGNYAVRLVFSDGHDTGIYPLTGFDGMGAGQGAAFAQYEADLEALGLSRDRPGAAPAPRKG
ncbi:MAG: gamma-butyrobetaine hydroxylase-like domain-containing protein [Pseudomonadota bacterium]